MEFESLTEAYRKVLMEDHSDPSTPVGEFLKSKSAVELLTFLKKEKHDLYEAVEKVIEEKVGGKSEK